ncbi:glutathione S-transferase family protein [Aestuariibius sp. HNIBRBA575]|uniref:glutathione S-transferase family protein n=1 Tax=Aestuariibius sp. HNIBRBA575 TaxID=3233343 RepID=UPI0034A40DF0
MLKLYHSAQSRSSRIVWLIDELGAGDHVEIVPVTIIRSQGPSGIDPQNPHPDGKVPALEHNGVVITESGAITQYLTDMFPANGLAPVAGDADRGTYLSWLHYYGGVIEPVLAAKIAEMDGSPIFQSFFRGFAEMSERLAIPLRRGPYLMGDDFSAADILIASPFVWFRSLLPEDPLIHDWVDRCAARPGFAQMTEYDATLMDQPNKA